VLDDEASRRRSLEVISEELGLTLAKAQFEQLGRARRVEVDKDGTTIIGGGGARARIDERVAALKKEREGLTSEYERKQLDERIAKLAGGVAVIKVGAATETELKERKHRIEDALQATRAAVEEGIVPGGGVALLRARKALHGITLPTLDQDSGLKIVARALEEPLRRIVANAADEPSIVLNRVEAAAERNYGYNAATREYGDLLAMGVIDPAKVTRLALQNAASIAGLVLTTDCLVADAPEEGSRGERVRSRRTDGNVLKEGPPADRPAALTASGRIPLSSFSRRLAGADTERSQTAAHRRCKQSWWYGRASEPAPSSDRTAAGPRRR
jgi:chaperonin GroEL